MGFFIDTQHKFQYILRLYVEGTKEQIGERVRESVETAASGNGYRYILCSGCQVPDNAILENVKYFLEAGQRYGRRPTVS